MTDNFYIKNGCITWNHYPHDEIDIDTVNWKDKRYKKALFARWHTDFDCKEETKFYYCIKDTPFDINSIKAKRRYEINKGNKNFYSEVINPKDYINELLNVYNESLAGYSHFIPEMKYDEFKKRVDLWSNNSAAVVFAVFERETNFLCGYADCYDRGKYIPISSLKTIPRYERDGVNFCLVNKIIEHFEENIQNGSYLSDGARNVLHQTNFQNFLVKYFGFRYAYCKLHITYRWYFKILIDCLMPFRKLFKAANNPMLHKVYAILLQEAWKRGLDE